MSQIEQLHSSVETPWGTAELVTSDVIREYARQGAEGLSIETDIGIAETAFYIDPETNVAPEHIRLLMMSGYSAGAKRDPSNTKRVSTLTIDGDVHGWRAQAFVNAETFDISHFSVALVDADLQFVTDKTVVAGIEARVRDVVERTVDEARTADPGFIPRVYSILMQRYEAELTETVDAIERQLEAARTHRDTVQALAGSAAERAASQEPGSAPSPRI